MSKKSYYSVLSIAGSDSGGGAGIQADLKTFSALGCFGTTAITAITVQNTLGVSGIHSIPPQTVYDQIKAVMNDIAPTAVKIGMVHNESLADAISSAIGPYQVPVVLDPVMVATSGDTLVENNIVDTLTKKIFPVTLLVTPNIYEAQILSGLTIKSKQDMKTAARRITQLGTHAVLIKGAHLRGQIITDVYLDQDGHEHSFDSEFVNTINTHGTGCTLSSAIAAYVAKGADLITSIKAAKEYVHQAIVAGKEVQTGKGQGPLNHFFNPKSLSIHEVE